MIFFVVGLMLPSCIDDEFTTSPYDVLTFSADTVNFDTVFTDLGTPTARLLVYNRSKKSINISDIRFKRPNSEFTLNVDGQSGTSFKDIEIRGNDSIFIFIECFVPETAGAEPFLVEDQLMFVTNSTTQEVQVEAYGQNVTRLRSHRVKSDLTLTAERPYVIFDSLVVEPGVKLTVEPGTKMLFHDKASLVVHGTFEALGEKDRFIDMRSDRLDNVLPDIGYDLLSGQWDGVRLAPESFGNRMEYVNMRSTVSGLVADSCAVSDRPKLTIVNSWLHNSQGNVLRAEYGNIEAYGSVFSEAADAVVSLTGGKNKFVQCTISNYYLFSVVSNPLLCLYHLLPEETNDNDLPLMKADFENCIIYGAASDMNQTDLTGTDVYMRNVLFRSQGEDDSNFIECIWGENPLFYTERSDYYFNYRLRPDSPAIGKGNAAYVSEICLYDMDGYDRLSDGRPDLGAYVFRPEEEEETGEK